MTYKVMIDKFRNEGTKVLYKDGDTIPSDKKIGDWKNCKSTYNLCQAKYTEPSSIPYLSWGMR